MKSYHATDNRLEWYGQQGDPWKLSNSQSVGSFLREALSTFGFDLIAMLEDRKRWRLLVPMRLCRMQSTSIHPGQPSLFLILSYTTDLIHSFL